MNWRSIRDLGIGVVVGAAAAMLLRQDPEAREAMRTERGPLESGAAGDSDGVSAIHAAPRSLIAAEDAELAAAVFRDFGADGPSPEDFRRVLFRPLGVQRRMAFCNLLAQLTPQNAAAVQALIADAAAAHDLHGEHRLLWERWGEIDGPAACRAIFKSNRRFAETELSKLTIRSWARQDPRAAYDWLMAQNDIPLRASMMRGVLDGFALANPEAAHDFVRDTITDPDLRAHGYWRVARTHLAANGLAGVEAYFERFSPDTPGYAQFTRTVADMFTDEHSHAALDWLGRLDEGGPPGIHNYVVNRLLRIMPDDLVQTLAAESPAAITDRRSVLHRAVERWARINPNDMGRWLGENQQLPYYDDVAAAWVEYIRPLDPVATKAWIGTIRNPELRAKLEGSSAPQ